jgi:hypothetical protein
MNLKVTGCKDPCLELSLQIATHFFAFQLLSPQMLPHIELEIVMKTKMEDLGNCAIVEFNDWYKAREFEIQLKRHRSLKNTLLTLAHEMVHLKQFAKGELNDANTKWKGQEIDTDVVEYSDWPWEIEANALELILYDRYVDHFTAVA